MSAPTERDTMFSIQTAEIFMKRIPADINGEPRRAAYATVTGCRDGKTPAQIAAYYSVNVDDVTHWIEVLGIDSDLESSKPRKSRKKGVLFSYVSTNVGKTVTPKEVADELGISLPTFYNFYNANRGFFRKVRRGEFEIINPDNVRASE